VDEQLLLADSSLSITRYAFPEYASLLSDALHRHFSETQGITIRSPDDNIHSLRPGIRLVSRTDITKRHQEFSDITFDAAAIAIDLGVSQELKKDRFVTFNSVTPHFSDKGIGYISMQLSGLDKLAMLNERNHVIGLLQEVARMPRIRWAPAPLDLTLVQAGPETDRRAVDKITKYVASLLPIKVLLRSIEVEASPSWS
jgi:hypothetical protein